MTILSDAGEHSTESQQNSNIILIFRFVQPLDDVVVTLKPSNTPMMLACGVGNAEVITFTP